MSTTEEPPVQTFPPPRRRSSLLGKMRQSSKRLFRSSRTMNGWTCDYCTFKNKNHEFLSCEMCGMVRALEEEEHKEIAAPEKTEYELQSEIMSAEMSRREAEIEQQLIEERMKDVIETQRQLYDEIAEKRVSRSSIRQLQDAQKSIQQLQKMVKDKEEEEPRVQVPVDAENLKPPPIVAAKATTTTTEPERSSIVGRRVSRRFRNSRKSIYRNPVESMNSNPWEEDSMGMNDILKCQEELWDRVKTDPTNATAAPSPVAAKPAPAATKPPPPGTSRRKARKFFPFGSTKN